LPSPTGQPTWGLHPFINTLSSCADTPDLDFLLQSVRTQGGVSTFSDDLSILQIAFH
jgi:sigma-B regulation protein RsbU (phosphoserine phosphatase)